VLARNVANLALNNVTVSGGRARRGCGVAVMESGTVEVRHSLFVDNSMAADGEAVSAAGGLLGGGLFLFD
jgi:hypothetical protein